MEPSGRTRAITDKSFFSTLAELTGSERLSFVSLGRKRPKVRFSHLKPALSFFFFFISALLGRDSGVPTH